MELTALRETTTSVAEEVCAFCRATNTSFC